MHAHLILTVLCPHTHIGNRLGDREDEEVLSIAGAPGAVLPLKVHLHEVPCHTGEHHRAGLPIERVVELVYRVVA